MSPEKSATGGRKTHSMHFQIKTAGNPRNHIIGITGGGISSNNINSDFKIDDIHQSLGRAAEGTLSGEFTKQTKSGNSTAEFKASQGVLGQTQEVVNVKDLNKGLN